jgi:CIC family chloride channel protein
LEEPSKSDRVGGLRPRRRLARLWRLYLLRAELRFAPSEAQRLFLLTLAIGVLCGLVAVSFHLSIDFAEKQLIERALTAGGRAWPVWTLLTPVLGGLVCGALLEFVVPNARGSGIPQVKAAFAAVPPVIPLRDALGKFVVGALQLGSGASLGREGPTVQICAGVASFLGRLLGVSERTQRRLLPVGAAAGIAAAFNAPIAAVTFTIEEVVGHLDQSVLSGVIVAAALAAVLERSVLGENPVFAVPETYGLRHASSLAVYAGIGLAAALASVAFTESLLRLRLYFRGLARPPRWMRPALGGAVTGALAVAAFAIFSVRGVTGGGYATLGQALNGGLAWRVMLALGAFKLVATVFSYSSGGAGGVFAPTLFIGGMLGGALGALDARWLGHLDEPIGGFALVGMGAVFSGVIRAPITSVLIIIEMTRGYSLILPLMIANMTAYVLARRFRSETLYEALLAQDGIVHHDAGRGIQNSEIAPLVSAVDVVTFAPETSAHEVMRLIEGREQRHVYPVLDPERRLLGIVTPDELAILSVSPELLPVTTAHDLMRPPVSIGSHELLGAAIETMLSSGLRELPVTGEDARLLGVIDDRHLASALGRGRAQASATLAHEPSRQKSPVSGVESRPRASRP